MARRNALLIIFIITALAVFSFCLHPSQSGSSIILKQAPSIRTVLLIPLDSRPPCNQFVIDAAKIGNIKIITPPNEILDYYYQESNTQAVADWLKDNLKKADAAIISVDQLLHGGLIASREGRKSPADAKKLLDYLRQLHRQNPTIPIYAFNILPRLTPPPSIGGYSLWSDFIEYSRLTDKLSLDYSSAEAEKLQKLKSELPAADLARYHSLFENNYLLNRELAKLAKDGTLKQLIIGQDDGEKYGLPNMKKRELQAFLTQKKIPAEKVFITHGADEIALSLIAKISAEQHHYIPKIHLEYNVPSAPDFIMPYMAGTVETTIHEKLQLAGASVCTDPADADFTLFVSCNDNYSLASRKESADRVKYLLSSGHSVALVDLCENFLAEETVFPFLIKNNTPLQQLIAYSGWNTASNSLGTAISQAIIFNGTKKDLPNKEAALALWQNNLEFLNNRFLEDYCFLKDIIDKVNFHLIKAGYTNTGDLDLEHNYRFANAMLQDSVAERLSRLKQTKSFQAPVTIKVPAAQARLRVKDLTVDTCFPWPRTFEIYLRTTLTLEEFTDK